MVNKQNRLGQGVTKTTSHLRSSCKPSGALAWVGRDIGQAVRLQRMIEKIKGRENLAGQSEASTQLIPSELPTDNAYFAKDISNLGNKDNKQTPL